MRKHLIVTLLSFTVSCVSNSFLLHRKGLVRQMSVTSVPLADWLQRLCKSQPIAAEMLARSPEEQHRLGYFHTLREICQQPSTWIRTSELMRQSAPALCPLVEGLSSLTLSGSGSSDYAGDCVRIALQRELGIDTRAIPGGTLLIHGSHALPVGRPGLMVSLARSGDSPESVGALGLMLKIEPKIRHLVLTCNRQGRLATTFHHNSKVTSITLDEATNDESLVMTSSFTNLVLAARFLGLVGHPDRYQELCEHLSRTASELIHEHLGTLAEVAKAPFRRVLFLGSGSRFAAAREAALKMLEMTAGRVSIMCESYLGLRHGPMSYVHQDTLVMCFLSSDSTLRAYEADVLKEMDQKRLGLARIIVGHDVSQNFVCAHDLVVPYHCPDVADEDLPVLDAIVGQLLALFRCLREGLQPDSPSEAGVIRRVVQSFTLHPFPL
jgi:tagatose-6-phosphate ketose/aldose isomerase